MKNGKFSKKTLRATAIIAAFSALTISCNGDFACKSKPHIDFSTVISILSLAATIWIPYKIMWEQEYSSLRADYRSPEFGQAVQAVIDFFTKQCGGDAAQIADEYKKCVKCERGECEKPCAEIRCGTKCAIAANKRDAEKTLTFQRRMLSQFYAQLDQCARSFCIGKNRIRRDFAKTEAELAKIVLFMNEAIDNDKTGVLWQDISSSDRPPRLRTGKNADLRHIISVLKKARQQTQ